MGKFFNKYRIIQIILLMTMVYFLFMCGIVYLIKSISINFETNVLDSNFKVGINVTTAIPKLKKISFPLSNVKQVILKEETMQKKAYYTLDFKFFDDSNGMKSKTFSISLLDKQYKYAQKIQDEINDALQYQKEFNCELISLNLPVFNKLLVLFGAFLSIMFVLFVIILIIEKKEKNRTEFFDTNKDQSNINNSIIK
jgi:hypothetical protein